ncbi:hypothetical protein GCM10022419_020180 [Nonomuraea rosea]|uniref:VOC domain-containing protein n=1 Tax=Nonomuraea rosea TaxID=638574 RepID=A0ABP6VWR2_9ACTN
MTTLGPQAGDLVNRPMLAVPRVARAVRWYRKALGATAHSGGKVVKLEVEGNVFWVCGLVGDAVGAMVAVKVFVDDPVGLVERAMAAGADDLDEVREHEVPWGPYRKGGFTDRYGYGWVVADRIPPSLQGPGRANHMGYVRAVAEQLYVLGFGVSQVTNTSTGTKARFGDNGGVPLRAASLFLPDWSHWPWCQLGCDVGASVDWDEEFGWSATKVNELNAGPDRGRALVHYQIGLGVAPGPGEVAWRLGGVFTAEPPPGVFVSIDDRRYRCREAASFDVELEATLAAYLPT